MAEFPIVGIGSSAGGLEALEKLFGAMPPDAGVAFVVVAHLDPTRHQCRQIRRASDQSGRVRLSWRLDSNPGRRVRLLWQEHGGPPIGPRDKKGFGTRLIERACAYALEGEMELEYKPGGLRCEMVFPVT